MISFIRDHCKLKQFSEKEILHLLGIDITSDPIGIWKCNLLQILTNRPTNRLTPPDQRTRRVIGKLHFQEMVRAKPIWHNFRVFQVGRLFFFFKFSILCLSPLVGNLMPLVVVMWQSTAYISFCRKGREDSKF